jgi:hypothetical protein
VPEEVIYHYTNTTGLIGILDTASIWATDIYFLNDSQEFTYARERFIRRIKDRLPSPEKSDLTHAEDIARHIAGRTLDRLMQEESAHRLYVSCFCPDGNLLSQWRGYGANDGVAIGFQRTNLGNVATIDEAEKRAELLNVSYGEQPNAYLGRVLSAFESVPNKERADIVIDEAFRAHVFQSFASMKHPGFKEEAEVRLLVVDVEGDRSSPKVWFRRGNLGPIPYIKVGFDRDAIVKIIIGPGPHHEVRKLGVERLLGTLGLGDVVVEQSETPYRI